MTSGLAGSSPPRATERPAIPDVLLEHLEEHGFLGLQRRRFVFSAELPLRRLPAHDERIEAHWQGLVVGGEATLALAEEKLEGEDPWEIATAARAWLMLGRRDAKTAWERFAAVPPEQWPGWREALRNLPGDLIGLMDPVAKTAGWPAPALVLTVDMLGTEGRLDLQLAQQAARHADAAVRGALARVLPHAGLEQAEGMLRPLLEDADEGVRRRALWSAALLAPEPALERCRRAVRGAQPDPFAVRVLGLLGTPDDHALLTAAAATDAGRPVAFWALGELGTPEAVQSLIRLLALPDDELRAIAGEALEGAIGAVPRKAPDAPPTPAEAAAHWQELEKTLPRDARVIAGHARPWREPAAEQPLRWLWRAAIQGERTGAPWLRREVPDGFFGALPVGDARPGE